MPPAKNELIRKRKVSFDYETEMPDGANQAQDLTEHIQELNKIIINTKQFD